MKKQLGIRLNHVKSLIFSHLLAFKNGSFTKFNLNIRINKY